jgi:hypothetical protein
MNPAILIIATLFVSPLAFACIAWLRAKKKIHVLRASGGYPQEGKESDADVARLANAGETVLAIRCYRQLHKVGLKEAHDAVLGRDSSKEAQCWPMIACLVVIAIAVFVSMQ